MLKKSNIFTFSLPLLSFLFLSNLNAKSFEKELNSFEMLIKEEIVLVETGKFSESIKRLESIKKKYPDNASIYYYLGKAYQKINNKKESIRNYIKASEINKEYAKPLMAIALHKGRNNELEETIKYLDKAIAVDSNYAKAFSNRGVAKGALNNNKGAIKDFDKAIEINPLFSEAYINRGITHQLLGDIYLACSDWKSATALGNKTAEEWSKNECVNSPEIKINEQKIMNNKLAEEIDTLKKKLISQENIFKTISIGYFPKSSELESINTSKISDSSLNSNSQILEELNTKDFPLVNDLSQSNLSSDSVNKPNILKTIDSPQISDSSLNSNSQIPEELNTKDFPLVNNLSQSNLSSDSVNKPNILKTIDSPQISDSSLNSNSQIPEELNTKDFPLVNNLSQSNLSSDSVNKSLAQDKINRNLTFGLGFFLASTIFLIVDKLKLKRSIKNKKNHFYPDPKKNSHSELNETNLLIEEKECLIKRLDEKKSAIENEIKLLNLDIDFLKIKQSNLKVYCISKYKNKIDDFDLYKNYSSIFSSQEIKKFKNYGLNFNEDKGTNYLDIFQNKYI